MVHTQELHMLQVWRDLFSYACLVAALVHLQQLDPSLHEASALSMSEGGTEALSSNKPKADSPQKAVATAMHELDMAAIMGGPLFRTEIDKLICAVQSLHRQHLDTSVAHTPVKRQRRFDDISSSDRPDSCCKQRKASMHRSQTKQQTSDKSPGKVRVARFAHHGDGGNAAQQQVQQLTEAPALLPPGSLLPHCARVPSEQLPSMER